MPRMGRIVSPNYPHHIVHRGHNRQVVFADETDYCRYLADLRELKTTFGVSVHAYCLMTNHVHLLLSPGEEITGLGRLMKALAARATRYRNKREKEQAHYGKVVTSQVQFRQINTCWPAADILNSIGPCPYSCKASRVFMVELPPANGYRNN